MTLCLGVCMSVCVQVVADFFLCQIVLQHLFDGFVEICKLRLKKLLLVLMKCSFVFSEKSILVFVFPCLVSVSHFISHLLQRIYSWENNWKHDCTQAYKFQSSQSRLNIVIAN